MSLVVLVSVCFWTCHDFVRADPAFDRNSAVVPISQVDVVGAVIETIHRFLSQTATKSPPPESDSSCNTSLLIFGEFEVKFSYQPHGFCNYCCRLDKPQRYVHFYFTDKANAGNPIQLKTGRKSGSVRAAGLDANLPTVMYIHGFTEHGLGLAARTIRDAYLALDEDVNIILVDWADLTSFPWYYQAAQNVKMVGSVLAKFLKYYNDTGELPIENLHVVGFSLGAHIAGVAGKYFRNPKIPRMTALDPALPLFPLEDSSGRIVKGDADFVDVIHTDAGNFGYPLSIGHADFYPNGGTFVQPGCESSSLIDRKLFEEYIYCGHIRAWQLYVESVRNPTAFPATKCGIMKEGSLRKCGFITESYMGYAAAKNTTAGDYFLITEGRSPFAKSAEAQELEVREINLIL